MRAAAAPADYHAALFAYNHADWYVAALLAKADEYRGAAVGAGGLLAEASATVGDVVHDPRVVLTPIQRGDLAGGLVDARIVSLLAAIGSGTRW